MAAGLDNQRDGGRQDHQDLESSQHHTDAGLCPDPDIAEHEDQDRAQHFLFSSRRRHTRWPGDWSSDVCSSDLHATARPVSKITRNVALAKSPNAIPEFVTWWM